MGRSLKKGPFIDPKLAKKVEKAKKGEATGPIRTWSRDSVIFPEMVGLTFEVHNGKNFIPVKVIEEMVGYRLGEFSPTRKFVKHGGRIAREQEIAAQMAAQTAASSAQAAAAPGAPGAAGAPAKPGPVTPESSAPKEAA
jgi:small subunit ribosomal protein S19